MRINEMRHFENLQKTSENRMAPRNYYIPAGVSEYKLLNEKEIAFAFSVKPIRER